MPPPRALLLPLGACLAAASAARPRPWLAPGPIEPRVQALLAAMSLEAKVAQTLQDISQRHSPAAFLAQWGNTSLGAVSELYFSGESVEELNAVQQALIANSSYGIPLLVWQETLHTAQSNGTIFPSPAGWGSTFDAELVRDAAAVIGAETRARGVHMGFSPELQVDTDPRFGRFMEAFAEDPRLVSLLGVAYATGAQGGAIGGPDSYANFSAIITNAKHAAAYGFGGMDGIAADIANRSLFDIYLRPWKHYFGEAGGRGAMVSHQSLNGSPNHANRWLLTDVFRGAFGANHSFFASDDGDVGRLESFGVAPDCPTSAVLAIEAGLDADLGPACFQTLVDSVSSGALDEAHVDRAAANVLRSKFAAGLFDGAAVADPNFGPKMQTEQAKALAYRVAAEGIVLVQNLNNTLPLDLGGKVRRVAVIGPNAGCASNVLPKYCAARGVYEGAYSWFATGPTPTLLNIFEEAEKNGTLANVTFVQGANISSYETFYFPAAIAAACAADAVVAVVGDNNGGYSTGTCDEGIDSDTLDIPGGQLALLDAVSAACAHVPLVVVLLNGRPATFGAGPFASTGANNALLARLPAVLVAWQPGQAGAQAICK
jgi:beta-glucosidase